MKIVKNEEAVSPVIGVILMVAITVILAAVIAAFVFNIGGQQQQVTDLHFSSIRANTTEIWSVAIGTSTVNVADLTASVNGVAAPITKKGTGTTIQAGNVTIFTPPAATMTSGAEIHLVVTHTPSGAVLADVRVRASTDTLI